MCVLPTQPLANYLRHCMIYGHIYLGALFGKIYIELLSS